MKISFIPLREKVLQTFFACNPKVRSTIIHKKLSLFNHFKLCYVLFPKPGIGIWNSILSKKVVKKNMYKTKLQEFCHKKRWALPIYSAMKDGSGHDPQFKASVIVNGTNFDTINVSKSLKEAYNEAAKLAWLHFSSDGELTRGGTNVDEQTMKIGDTDSQIQMNQDDNELLCKGKKFEQAVNGGVSVNLKNSSFGDGSVNLTAEINAAEQSDRMLKGPEIHQDSFGMEHDLNQKFKAKLQIYAQRKNIGLPTYHSTREGPPNSLCFRTTVTIGGDSFNSPGSYKTIKQAEDAAAQVALMAFSTEAFQENDIRLYKNLLQEYALREGLFIPQYKTTRAGEAHDPTFNATVEVEGEIFHGNPAMSKKQAELSAAKVAYTNLMQRKSCQTGDFSSGSSRKEVLKLASCFNFLTNEEVRVSHISESKTSSTLSAIYGVPTEVSKDEDEETVSSGYLEAKTGFEKEAISVPVDTGKCFKTDDISSTSSEDVLKLTHGKSSHSINIREMQKSKCPTISTPTAKCVAKAESKKVEEEEAVLSRSIPEKTKFKIKENIPVSSCKDSSSMKMDTDMKSYLINNRIRVYTYIPDVASTNGNVVLPIGEGKWVVGSLEFPK